MKMRDIRRRLTRNEHALLELLIDVCEPLYGSRADQWKAQVATCRVREIGSQHYLAVCHDENIEKAGCDAITLGRELVALDDGVPVLVYAVLMKTANNYLIDIFDVDRLDGEPLIHYPTDFGTWIRLFIGPVGDDAADTFDLLVCTPLWLAYNVKREPGGAMWGRHMLIVSEYDPDRIKACAIRLVSELSGDDWVPIAEKIARFAAWEFEDYQEETPRGPG